MTAETTLARAFHAMADGCGLYGSPFYEAVGHGLAEIIDRSPPLKRLFAPWEGEPLSVLAADAAPLRFMGAIHDLVLAGDAFELDGVFPGDAPAAVARIPALCDRRREAIAEFITRPPQTNEVNRSAALLGGFLTIAKETGLPMRTFEIGASAGLNMNWDLYAYDLGDGGAWGDPESPVRLKSRWKGGPPPLEVRPQVVGRAAVDKTPIDIADAREARRLQSYLWPDQPERLARQRGAVALGRSTIRVETGDAAEWTERRLGLEPGAVTVLYHSVCWQYFPPKVQERVRAVIARCAAAATPEAPFAWLKMEPNVDWDCEVRLTLWPGPPERRLARVHPHGADIEWFGG